MLITSPPSLAEDRAPTKRVLVGSACLEGDLSVPAGARGLVLFAHGSGSSRRSPRNQQVAQGLHRHELGTLLFDLLTPAEAEDRALVFDIDLLARRLVQAIDWIDARPALQALPLGLFGASTGAAAALRAAAQRGARVRAVVSRGGRPDLAGASLSKVRSPTLLIVGGEDTEVMALNLAARKKLGPSCELSVVPGATHLFEEPGALARVTELAGQWFVEHLPG